MLSNLNTQELVRIFNGFRLAILNHDVPTVVSAARYDVDKAMNIAVCAGRLADRDLILIFDLFMAHDFLRYSALSGPGMLSTTINTTYEHAPYTQGDLTMLHARLI
ncbi:hypothetical protein B7H19_11110 [Pseudomonas putida]|uniref:hypothetical protein n=1 Tax=Pseudomonas putida TaxID=303 RepID=UPI000A0FD23B|nr:hypothetical protein [Pseudomonas putida]ORL69467.1 hypothetical protein B7H19_11110 [Pseudomonas putida]